MILPSEILLNKRLVHTQGYRCAAAVLLVFYSPNLHHSNKSRWPCDVSGRAAVLLDTIFFGQFQISRLVPLLRGSVAEGADLRYPPPPAFVFFFFYFRANSLCKVSREATPASLTTCDSSRPRGLLLRLVTMNDSLLPGRWWRTNAALRSRAGRLVSTKASAR